MYKKLLGLTAAICAVPVLWAGIEAVTTNTSTELPYHEEFDSQAAFDQWTVIDANQDGYTFHWSSYGGYNWNHGSATYAMNQNDAACADYGDDWLISPAFELQADRNYHLSFFTRGTIGMQTDLKVFVGQEASVEGMTQLIFTTPDDNYNVVRDMEFCVPADGTYYIGFHEASYGGETKYTYSYSNNISDVRLSEASSRLVPAQVTDLTQQPGANGAQTMGLTWTLPATTLGGTTLESLQEVRIYKDGAESPIILTDNLVPGITMTWSDPTVTPGSHTYSLTTVNEAGESYSANVCTFVGKDMPGAPLNLSATVEGTVVTLGWEAAPFGLQGGWYDASSLRYRVVRQPGNTLLVSDLTETTYVDNSITSLSAYTYQITAVNAEGVGGTSATDMLRVGKVANFPLRQDFEDEAINSLWTVVDTNGDGEGWRVTREDRGHNAPLCLLSDLWNAGLESQDLYFSPAVKIEKGETYRVSFWANTNLYNTETIYLYYGKDRTAAAMSKQAAIFEDISTSASYEQFSATFEAEANFSVGYFAFYVPSFNSRFYMDDIKIEHVTTNDIEIAEVNNVTTAITVGREVSTQVNYRNAGSAQCKNFKVELVDMDGNVLASKNVARAVNAGVTNSTTLTWTPTTVGKMAYYARATFKEENPDTQPDNNVSAVQYLTVLPATAVAQTTGSEQSLNSFFPFWYYGQTFNETVYPAQLLDGVTGTIDSLAYKVHFGHERDYYDIHYQIWMGETSQFGLSAGWIPSTELQLVFDGGIDLTYGIKDLVIPFQHPYDYKGGNLVVMVYSDKEWSALTDGYGIRTYCSYVGSSMTRYWYQEYYADIDPANPDQEHGRFSDYVPNTIFYINVADKGAISGTVTTSGKGLAGATVGVAGTNLSAKTDAQGLYSLPYVNTGVQTVIVNCAGYETDSASVNVTAQGAVQQNFDLKVKPQVTVSGRVVGSNDVNQPLADAEVRLSLYDNYNTYTDGNGAFSIGKVWGNATYLLTVDAVGYQTYTDTLRVGGDNIDLATIVIAQEASQSASVKATDAGQTAQISWTEPIAARWLKKDQTDCVGSFGGQYNYSVAHRYLPSEMQSSGLVDGLYVTRVRFYAASSATFELKIWQGQTGAEAEVYSQPVNITTYDDWSEIELDTPYRIDLTKNLLVGFHVSQQVGARPVGFDYGPLMAGGDVLFDDDSNTWTDAHSLVETMAYNWLIRTYCSVDANNHKLDTAPDWGEAAQQAPRRSYGIGIQDPKLERIDGLIVPAAEAAYGFTLDEVAQQRLQARPRATADIPDSTKPMGYNVWRLINGQEQNEAAWTLVTPEPVASLSYEDNSWSAAPDQLYRYAVRSVFVGGVESEPTFSNGVDKGKYATVTGHVTAQTNNAVGAVASLENSQNYYEAVVDAEGNVRFDDVYFGLYTYSIRKSYFETLETSVRVDAGEVTLAEQELLVDARKPKIFTATDYVSNVQLTWAAPSNSQGEWVHKDGNPVDGGIGYNSGGTIIAGQRFTPAELERFAHSDFYVTYIAVRTFMEGDYTIRIYSGNAGNEFEIYSQKTHIDTYGEWTAVRLDQPLKIDPYFSYVFGYEVEHEAGYYPVGYDEGPEVEGGDVMYYNEGWHTFYQASAAQYSVNWSIRTFITDDFNEVIDPETIATSSSRLLASSRKAQAEEEMPITYRLWRTTEAAKTHSGQWTPLTSEDISETSFDDQTWANVGNGNYYYIVKAIYNGVIESQPVYSKLLEKGNTTLVNLSVTTNNGEPAEGAFVTLANETNRYSTTIHADTAQLTGVYLGTYELTAALEGFDTIRQQVTFTEAISEVNLTLEEILYAPVGLKVRINEDNNAVLTWRKPNTYVPTPGWHYWDNDEVYAAFSMNGSFFGVGHLYNVYDQKELGMKELYITQVAFPILDYAVYDSVKYAPTDGTYVIKIWKGESLDEVYSQTLETYTKNGWNYVTLDEPFYVDGSDYLMFGYEFTGTGYPAAIDRGPAVANKGDIGATSQGSWYPLNQTGYNYNFVFHVYGEELEEEETADHSAPRQRILFDGDEAIEVQDNADDTPVFIGTPASLTLGQEMELPTPANQQRASQRTASEPMYKVWRYSSKEIIESLWTLLTPEPISETRFVDENWHTLNGSYKFTVKAVYATGDSKGLTSEVIRTTGISEVETGSISVSATTRGLTIQTPEAGSIELYNAAGVMMLSAKLLEGRNDCPVMLVAGSYVAVINGQAISFSVK